MFSRLLKGRKEATPAVETEPVARKKKKSSRKTPSTRRSKSRSSSRKEYSEDANSSVSGHQQVQDSNRYSTNSSYRTDDEELGNGDGVTAEDKFVSYYNQKRATESVDLVAGQQLSPSNSIPETYGSGDHLAEMTASIRKKQMDELEYRRRQRAEEDAGKQGKEQQAEIVEEVAAPDFGGMTTEEQRRAKARMAVEDRKRKAREAVAARKAKAKAASMAKAGVVSDDEDGEDFDGIAQARSQETEQREIEEERLRSEAASLEKRRLLEEAEAARQAQKARDKQEELERQEKLAFEEEERNRQQMEMYREELRLEEELRVAEERAKEEEDLRQLRELEEEERKLNEEMALLQGNTGEDNNDEGISANEDVVEAAEEEKKAREQAEEERRLEEERHKVEEARITTEKLAAEQAEMAKAAHLAAEKLAAEKLATEKIAAEMLAAEQRATEQAEAARLAAEKIAATNKAAAELADQVLEASETDLSALLNGDDSFLGGSLEGSPTPMSPSRKGGLRSSLTKILSVGKKKSADKKGESPASLPKQKVQAKPVSAASSVQKAAIPPVPNSSRGTITPRVLVSSTVSGSAATEPPKRSSPEKIPSPKRTPAAQESLPPPSAVSGPPKHLTIKTETSPPKMASVPPRGTPAHSTPTSTFRPSPRVFSSSSPARSVDSTGSISSVDRIPRSPYMKLQDDQEAEPVCRNPYVPNLHTVRGPCQVCVFRLSEADRARLELNGRSLLVNFTTGGCIHCEAFPPGEDEEPVRICKKCFFDTHLPPERREEAFSGTGALAGTMRMPKATRGRGPVL